jgi:hypothetical protein
MQSSYTVTSINNEARALLNDQGINKYTDTILLPYDKKAYDELQHEMFISKLATLKEVAAILVNVPAVTTVLNGVAGFPTDLYVPVDLSERAGGSVVGTEFAPMEEREWDPDIDLDTAFRYWVWREEEIKVPGATSARDIRLTYMKFLTQIVDSTSTITVDGANTFLSARVASLAARYIDQNDSRADTLALDALNALEKLKIEWAHRKQSKPMRRRGMLTGRR